MSNKSYKVKLTTLGPVHIGNGSKYGRKDYFQKDGKIAILNAPSFVGSLTSEQLASYCKFLEGNSESGLQDFLEEHNLLNKTANFKAYQLSDSFKLVKAKRGTWQYYEVAQFIKDAYGCPYVPGSSIKGMIRSALLIYIILKNQSEYAGLFNNVLKGKARKKEKSVCQALEKRALWVEKPDEGIVNDIMRYVSVSDSEPLEPTDLVFAKKCDKFSNNDSGSHKRQMGGTSAFKFNEANDLNIYRESLRPGTTIVAMLNIDSRIDQYLNNSLDCIGLQQILEQANELYKECFRKYFDLSGVEGESQQCLSTGNDDKCKYIIQTGSLAGSRCRNRAIDDTGYCNTHQSVAQTILKSSSDGSVDKELICYLGGGVGYASKTVTSALFANRLDSVNEIAHILFDQFPSRFSDKYVALANEAREAGFYPKDFRVRSKQAKDDHRHWQDPELGVSPHTIKLGLIGNTPYEMGKCQISIEAMR
jgi:CRISPR/Cas system CSM-associated protein Csm5 (group 7 of RAMP superfamily)